MILKNNLIPSLVKLSESKNYKNLMSNIKKTIADKQKLVQLPSNSNHNQLSGMVILQSIITYPW